MIRPLDRVLDALSWTIDCEGLPIVLFQLGFLRAGLCGQCYYGLSWYGQAPECLSNEDRQHRNEKQQTSTCQCDSRAEAWLNSIQTLR